METSQSDLPENSGKNNAKEVMIFESKISQIMISIASKLAGKVKSFQLMTDTDFPVRNRTTKDVHIFFELKNNQYFHLKAYTKHMLDIKGTKTDQIFLTGYLKPAITQDDGVHSLRQTWYEWNPEVIANEILEQNPGLF
jgi:hypothetical protein